MDVKFYRGAKGDTDHQLVITKVREVMHREQRKQRIKQLKFEVKRLDNTSVKADYQLEISNRFVIIADSSSNKDEINSETDVSKMWEAIRDKVKSAAKELVGEKKDQKIKP